MDIDYYQDKAVSFLLPQSQNLEYLMTGLAAEAGETCGHYAKQIRDKVDKRELILKELGDVLYFVAAIAHMYSVDLSEIANSNIDKLTGRIKRGTLQGSGDER